MDFTRDMFPLSHCAEEVMAYPVEEVILVDTVGPPLSFAQKIFAKNLLVFQKKHFDRLYGRHVGFGFPPDKLRSD